MFEQRVSTCGGIRLQNGRDRSPDTERWRTELQAEVGGLATLGDGPVKPELFVSGRLPVVGSPSEQLSWHLTLRGMVSF